MNKGTTGKPTLFLDRDGVLIEDHDHLTNPDDMIFIDGVAEAVRAAQENFFVVVVTNQSGIARGFLNEDTLLEIHRRLVGRLSDQEAIIDALFYCPHYAEGIVKDLSIECDCRKPKPGMLNKAAQTWGLDLSASHIVGDRISDAEAGESVGSASILLGAPTPGAPSSRRYANDLREAVTQILGKNLET